QPVKHGALPRSGKTSDTDFHSPESVVISPYKPATLANPSTGHCTIDCVIWLLTTGYGPRTEFMCDGWMPLLQLPITIAHFRQFPRNAAYKYEFLAGEAYLNPRPKHYHALLELRPIEVPEPVTVRPVKAGELLNLVHLFAGSFRYIQPYGC